jgi:hypothetical protein
MTAILTVMREDGRAHIRARQMPKVSWHECCALAQPGGLEITRQSSLMMTWEKSNAVTIAYAEEVPVEI